jgi:hypothetical protein
MVTDSLLPRPNRWHRAAAWLVLLGCELAMTGCWVLAGEFLNRAFSPYALEEHIRLSVVGFLLGLFPTWLAIRQYQAMFRYYRRAAKTTIAMLVIAAVLITVSFIGSIAEYDSERIGEDNFWWAHLIVLWTVWFAVVMNWDWATQLKQAGSLSAPPPWQISLGEIVGLTTALAIQFALAGVALRSR